ncbi:MAG: ABC transporter ATP-binding protein, partial [Verrucomicrobia bacterium RIFCSPLOWO2_12_FULL_64_8]
KQFGNLTAVDGITFDVDRGEVLGFLGPNGAGKSTTMKMITCFIAPTAGTVVVGGKDILGDPLAVRRQIGYLPESAPSYGEMTVTEFLRFMAEMRGMRGAAIGQAVERVVEITALDEVRRQIVETLSKGYRQRTCFAQALIHDPPVLILDEPTDGLDPNQKHEMRELIGRMRHEKTIILSTHILEEMEAVCSRAVIIARGRIVADGTPEGLAAMSRYHNAVTLRTHDSRGESLKEKFKTIDGVGRIAYSPAGGGGGAFTLFPDKGKIILPGVTRYLEQQKIAVDEVFTERGRVDEVFREVTQSHPRT